MDGEEDVAAMEFLASGLCLDLSSGGLICIILMLQFQATISSDSFEIRDAFKYTSSMAN